jgi:hypothetical protein
LLQLVLKIPSFKDFPKRSHQDLILGLGMFNDFLSNKRKKKGGIRLRRQEARLNKEGTYIDLERSRFQVTSECLDVSLLCFGVHLGHDILPYMAPDFDKVWVLGK